MCQHPVRHQDCFISAFLLQGEGCAERGSDLQLARKFLPVFSAAWEPYGNKQVFQVFFFCPYPPLLKWGSRGAIEVWLLSFFFSLCPFSLPHGLEKGTLPPSCLFLLAHAGCYTGRHLGGRGFSAILEGRAFQPSCFLYLVVIAVILLVAVFLFCKLLSLHLYLLAFVSPY